MSNQHEEKMRRAFKWFSRALLHIPQNIIVVPLMFLIFYTPVLDFWYQKLIFAPIAVSLGITATGHFVHHIVRLSARLSGNAG